MKPHRLKSLPESMRRDLRAARIKLGWSQAALGRHVGLPQSHVSGIETGKIVPRFDTLIDLVRILGHDLVLVPRALVPAVNAMVRDSQQRRSGGEPGDRSLYSIDPDDNADDDRVEDRDF